MADQVSEAEERRADEIADWLESDEAPDELVEIDIDEAPDALREAMAPPAGPGRPALTPGEESVKLQVRVPVALYERLEAVAAEADVSVSALVRVALDRFVAHRGVRAIRVMKKSALAAKAPVRRRAQDRSDVTTG
ncbi:MAG: ribbon-helix-helix protein, CopG family [Actinomycetota bacterium]